MRSSTATTSCAECWSVLHSDNCGYIGTFGGWKAPMRSKQPDVLPIAETFCNSIPLQAQAPQLSAAFCSSLWLADATWWKRRPGGNGTSYPKSHVYEGAYSNTGAQPGTIIQRTAFAFVECASCIVPSLACSFGIVERLPLQLLLHSRGPFPTTGETLEHVKAVALLAAQPNMQVIAAAAAFLCLAPGRTRPGCLFCCQTTVQAPFSARRVWPEEGKHSGFKSPVRVHQQLNSNNTIVDPEFEIIICVRATEGGVLELPGS